MILGFNFCLGFSEQLQHIDNTERYKKVICILTMVIKLKNKEVHFNK